MEAIAADSDFEGDNYEMTEVLVPDDEGATAADDEYAAGVSEDERAAEVSDVLETQDLFALLERDDNVSSSGSDAAEVVRNDRKRGGARSRGRGGARGGACGSARGGRPS